MKVCDGIYAYIWKGVFENNCNTFYFGEPLNILFDAGLKNYVDMKFEEMMKDGLDPEAMKYLINSHCHPDHFEGSLLFADNEKVTIGMHREEIEFFNTVGPRFFQMFGMDFPKINFGLVMEDGPWEVAGTALEVFKTPGHSPGSVCVYWKEKKALVCGDLIFKQSMGRVDFPGGSGELIKDSIRRMSELDVDYLLPGHMDMVIGKENVRKNFAMVLQYLSMM